LNQLLESSCPRRQKPLASLNQLLDLDSQMSSLLTYPPTRSASDFGVRREKCGVSGGAPADFVWRVHPPTQTKPRRVLESVGTVRTWSFSHLVAALTHRSTPPSPLRTSPPPCLAALPRRPASPHTTRRPPRRRCPIGRPHGRAKLGLPECRGCNARL
jgi:hypothetical protein